jgi:hypothetical protein
MPPIGVFQIVNLRNGRSFIGKSNDLDAAISRQRKDLQEGTHRNEALQKDWVAFGEDAFRFVILATLPSRTEPGAVSTKELEALEDLWLHKLQPYGPRGYNGEPRRQGQGGG